MGRKKKNTNVMSQPEQIQLVREYLKTGDIKIKERLVLEADGFIRNIINKSFEYPHLEDDMMQEGRAAVSRAIEKFNPDLDYTLANWLHNCIYRALITYVAYANNYNRLRPELTPRFEQMEFLSQDENLDDQILEKISYDEIGFADADWQDSIDYYSQHLTEKEQFVFRGLLEQKKLVDLMKEHPKLSSIQKIKEKIATKLQNLIEKDRSNNFKYNSVY